MAKSCVYMPKHGKNTFLEMKKRYGYEKSAHIFNIISRKKFINEFKDSLVLDKDGIPTFDSIMKNKLVRDYFTEKTIIEAENKIQPHVEDTIENTKNLINKAAEYNKEHSYNIAIVDYDNEDNLTIRIVENNAANREVANVQSNILKLNETITDTLSSVGVTLGSLMKVEKGIGRVGVTDFNNAKAIGEQFVNLIRVANNMEGYKAISEEFSHLIVGIFRQDPLILRAINHFSNEDNAREILGEEYDTISDFYDGDSAMIAEEAVGKALRNAFLNLEEKKPVKQSLIKRFINKLVGLFKRYNPSTLQDSIDNINKDLSKLAEGIISGKTKLTKAQIEATKANKVFNALSKKAEIQTEALKEALKNFSKVSALRTNLSTLREGEDTSQKAQAWEFYDSVKKAVNEGIKTEETVAAIANVLSLSVKELRAIIRSLQDVEGLSTKDKFIVYQNCLYTAMAFAPTISNLKELMTSEYLNDEQIANQKFVIGDIENTLQEFENEVSEAIDTSNLSDDEIANLITSNSSKWVLSDDNKYYVNTETGAKAKRVTDIIQYTEDGEIFDENSPWVTPSTNIGTGVDNFVRDFFAGKIDDKTDKELEKLYPNANGKDLIKFREQLKGLKEKFDAKGITIIPRDVTVDGHIETVDGKGKIHKISVVGTLDLVGYDKDGNWYIYDMKTHRSKIKQATKKKYAKQLSLYKQLLEDKYGINIKELNVIPIKVSYPTPAGATTAQDTGTAKYTEGENNQLYLDDEEFRDASPKLDELLPIEETNVEVEYAGLSGDNTNGLGDAIKHTIDTLHTVDDLYSAFMSKFSSEALDSFVEFLKPFVGETIEVRNKNGEMVKTTLEAILKHSDKDVSLLQQWFSTMADNPDALLQIFDKVYSRQIVEKNQNTIDMSQRIMALAKEFEARGITSYDFMFEDDKKHYVGVEMQGDVNVAYDKSAYEAAKKEYARTLDAKYGKYPIFGSDEYKEKNAAIKQWIKDNSRLVVEENGFKHYVPSYEKYPSKYNSFSDTQKEFYDRWMELKEELDANLGPKATTLFSTIKIRKGMMERTKDALLRGDFKTFGKEAKSQFVRSYDDEIVYTKGIKGFNGEEILKLPTYYINENPNLDCSDLSTDVISTLCAYAEMSYNYKAMSEVLSPLEIGRWLAYNVNGRGRTIQATKGGRQLMERWRAGGRTTESPLTIDVNQSNFKKTLDQFFESKIYQRYLKDSGEIGGVDVNKGMSFLLRLGSAVQLGVNVLAGLANIGTGVAMMNIEAAAGEFFNASELAKADASYVSLLKDYIGDIGQRVQDSWLSLFDDMFDVKQDYRAKIKNKDWLNKTVLTRVFGPGMQFICQTMGDHWLYNRVALGIAIRHKLLDKDGKEISLKDALIRVPVIEGRPELGYKLVVKEGVTNLDGSTFTRNDISRITDLMKYVNHHLFGVYDPESAIAARQVIWGRFLMQYRDWIPSQFRYRFGTKTSNLKKGGTVEGYYRTAWSLGKQLYNEVLTGDKQLKQIWDELDDWQKRNCRRAITEVSQFMIIAAIATLLGKSKDKDRSWAMKMLNYWAAREKTELAALVPSPFMLTEGIKLVKSPVANTSIWSDIANLQTCLWVPNWYDEIENGEYKGHSSGYRAFMRSPATLWYRNIKRTFDPEKAQQFYNQ